MFEPQLQRSIYGSVRSTQTPSRRSLCGVCVCSVTIRHVASCSAHRHAASPNRTNRVSKHSDRERSRSYRRAPGGVLSPVNVRNSSTPASDCFSRRHFTFCCYCCYARLTELLRQGAIERWKTRLLNLLLNPQSRTSTRPVYMYITEKENMESLEYRKKKRLILSSAESRAHEKQALQRLMKLSVSESAYS